MRLDTRLMDFTVKSMADNADGVGTIEGIGAVFMNIDWKGDIIAPGAFVRDLAFFTAEGKIRDEHMVTTGKVDQASETPEGLNIKGTILPTVAGKDQWILAKGKAITKLSIGVMPIVKRWLESEEEVQAWWASKGYTPTEDDLLVLGRSGGARLIERGRPYEVSTTWFPANDKTRITSVKSGSQDGLTLSDQATLALAAVGDFLERVDKVREIRSREGRGVSMDTKARLKQVNTRLNDLMKALETKSETPPADVAAMARNEFARFLRVGSGV